jgi:hypothetical protein
LKPGTRRNVVRDEAEGQRPRAGIPAGRGDLVCSTSDLLIYSDSEHTRFQSWNHIPSVRCIICCCYRRLPCPRIRIHIGLFQICICDDWRKCNQQESVLFGDGNFLAIRIARITLTISAISQGFGIRSSIIYQRNLMA